jgi:hypothetical protein
LTGDCAGTDGEAREDSSAATDLPSVPRLLFWRIFFVPGVSVIDDRGAGRRWVMVRVSAVDKKWDTTFTRVDMISEVLLVLQMPCVASWGVSGVRKQRENGRGGSSMAGNSPLPEEFR